MKRRSIDARDLNRILRMVTALKRDSRLFAVLLEGELHNSVHLPGLYARWPLRNGKLHALFFDHTQLDAVSAFETLSDAAQGTLAPLVWCNPPVAVGWGKLLHWQAHGSTPSGGQRQKARYALERRTVLLRLEKPENFAGFLTRCVKSVPDEGRGHLLEVAIAGVDPQCKRQGLFNGAASGFLAIDSNSISTDSLVGHIDEFLHVARRDRALALQRAARLGRFSVALRPLFERHLRVGGYPRTDILVSEVASNHLRNSTILNSSWFVVPVRSDHGVTISSIRLVDGGRKVALTGRMSETTLLKIAHHLGKGLEYEIFDVL